MRMKYLEEILKNEVQEGNETEKRWRERERERERERRKRV